MYVNSSRKITKKIEKKQCMVNVDNKMAKNFDRISAKWVTLRNLTQKYDTPAVQLTAER